MATPEKIGKESEVAGGMLARQAEAKKQKEQRNANSHMTGFDIHTDRDQKDADRHPMRKIAFSSLEDVVIHTGRFSWISACFMCIFIITGFVSAVLAGLSMRNTAWPMLAEETSYIDAPNPPWDVPPWGYVLQPDDATERKIGRKFAYAMPQTMLFYSLSSASFGLFTVCYFCSELLVQDCGITRVKSMGDVINKGIDTYLFRTVPCVMFFMSGVAGCVYFMSGLNFVISMLVGASTALFTSQLGINMNFEGGARLTHCLNSDLVASLQMGIRTGAIGGLASHSMAQLGMVLVWMIVRDANALLGFGAGVSIVAFYNRVGGGIFSKGSDIGSDYVSAMLGEDVDDYNMDAINALKYEQDDPAAEDLEDTFEDRQKILNPNAYVNEDDFGYITQKEAELRAKIEEEMEKTLHTMHPVNYLDAIGENIADVGGTASDLFETLCMTLATSVNFGSRAHEVPYFGTSLPFNIISTGTICCSLATYYVWAHERHSSNRIRNSLRLNLFLIMLIVEGTVATSCYLHWKVWKTISFDQMIAYDLITLMGLVAPEICAYICEAFTSVNCAPVRWIASNAHLGMIQVILQGLGQGFVSAGVPSIVNITTQIMAYRLDGFYGLTLLACASQACTGWQASIAAYGAVANNGHRMVYLTTTNEIAQHRANVLAVVGTTTAHNGKCVAGQNAFFATTGLLGALMAEKYTSMGKNYKSTVGQELSQWTRAGLLAGIVFTMLFLANTLTSCINMAKSLVVFCKDNPEVEARKDKTFPATHIVPLQKLVAFASVESFQLTLSPMLQTAASPLVIGQLFGFKGLLMMVSGGNSVCFSMSMFLINSGQAWDAARKYVLFGMLRGEDGHIVGAESEVYDVLGIGEQIGGPLEDLSGPALNNFIKFVTVISFVTEKMYEEFPDKTWPMGVVQVVVNFAMVSFFKFGLAWTIKAIDQYLQARKDKRDFEEGATLLREIHEREKAVEMKMQEAGMFAQEEVQLF